MHPYTKITSGLLLLLSLAACNSSETDTASGAVNKEIVIVNQQETANVESSALIGTAWWVEDILSAGVIDNARTTIGFEDGRVAGSGGCNRYTGSFELDRESISFGPVAGTMMACPEALMNQDQRFHEALGLVTSWRIDESTGLLHLENQEGETVIRASALPPGEDA